MNLRVLVLAMGLFSFYLVSGGALGDHLALPTIDNVAADDGDDCKPMCDVDCKPHCDLDDCKPYCDLDDCRPFCSLDCIPACTLEHLWDRINGN